MSLDLKYFRNLWNGTWDVANTATGQKIVIPRSQIRTDPFPLANTGTTATTFSFKGYDPRQKRWNDYHRMFSLVIKKDDKQLVIKWEDGSGIPDEVLPFSGDGKVLLTLDKENSGVLAVIVDDGKIGETEMAWKSYYDKCPAPKDTAAPSDSQGYSLGPCFRSGLSFLINDAKMLLHQTESKLTHVYRAANQCADHLARMGAEQNEHLIVLDQARPYIHYGVPDS